VSLRGATRGSNLHRWFYKPLRLLRCARNDNPGPFASVDSSGKYSGSSLWKVFAGQHTSNWGMSESIQQSAKR
jgi:hypothetical protein